MNNINEIKDIFYTSSEIVEFKHFRVSIFASYSSDKVIDDSVVFYLKELIFCNDSVYGPYYPKKIKMLIKSLLSDKTAALML